MIKFSQIWNLIRNKTRSFFQKRKTIIIINNYPGSYQPERVLRLENLIRYNFPELHIKTIHYSEINKEEIRKSIGLILTGSSINVSSFSNNTRLKESFKNEIELITDLYKKPILAICYGHQLAAYAFGGNVERMSFRVVSNDIKMIELKQKDKLIPFKSIQVNLNHRDYVSPNDETVKKNFNIVSVLNLGGYDTVQYMRHKSKPIYSVQFHPENHIGNFKYSPHISDEVIDEAKIVGQKLITNFISICL
ncbi:MAG: hypothetical protein GF317_20705 [Candidatus Lokiarchaeota archaeon]|nr:hypothetical protein [Candidatus Lokiarchaeota archaeon]MBD3201886.1 hypothetical protein [Candidatus Lokiarchaeota archaeon]